MLNKMSGGRFLSGNALKVIASILMLIDHTGYILFPQYTILRIIGRLSFPIFAFMIAEGCYYTRNKFRYFFSVFSLAVVCQIAYYIFENSLYMGILVTFSLSIFVIFISLAFILIYSGQRGKFNMKIFFYVFYPLHLMVLQIISILMK